MEANHTQTHHKGSRSNAKAKQKKEEREPKGGAPKTPRPLVFPCDLPFALSNDIQTKKTKQTAHKQCTRAAKAKQNKEWEPNGGKQTTYKQSKRKQTK